MGITDKIETFIIELLKDDSDDWLELRRNELASIFNCVPSQINYVMSTRFNSERGYIVESRRGGGGYLRIKRINTSHKNSITQALSKITTSIDYPAAKSLLTYIYQNNDIDNKTLNIILSGVSDRSITVGQPVKDIIRANILKNMLVAYLDNETDN